MRDTQSSFPSFFHSLTHTVTLFLPLDDIVSMMTIDLWWRLLAVTANGKTVAAVTGKWSGHSIFYHSFPPLRHQMDKPGQGIMKIKSDWIR